MNKFDYKKVKNKYEDSLSQYNFDEIFNNLDHGTLKFSDSQKKFEDFFEIIYELENLDFRENLHQQDINQVESIRNQTIVHFNQISQFALEQPNAPQVKENIANQTNHFIESQSKILDDILIKIKMKNFFTSSKSDVNFKEAQREKEKIIELREETEKIKLDAEKAKKELEEDIRKIQSLKIPSTEKRLATERISHFFLNQAEEHKRFAEERKEFKKSNTNKNNNFFKKIYYNFRRILNKEKETRKNWEKERSKFLKYIYFLLGISSFLYLSSFLCVILKWFDGFGINEWKSFWDLRVGFFVFALLSVFYTGLYFATKNYSKEKSLEYQNKNRANIANTIRLISSGENDRIREIVYTEAIKTIFSDIYQEKQSKDGKGQSVKISLPNPNLSKIIDDNLNKQ